VRIGQSISKLASVLFVLLSCLTACASANLEAQRETVNRQMQSWIGHHQADLILSWGPPQQTASDGNGGTILIYSWYRPPGNTVPQVGSPGSVLGAITQGFGQETGGYTATRMFYVNGDGVIYHWRWQNL
jgi:hypothetical protein